jgi:PAP2 superfamily
MAQLTAPSGVSPPAPRTAARPRLSREIALIAVFWAAYTAVRLLIPHGDRVAYAHAGQVLRLEGVLGLDVELGMNRGLMRMPWLADLAAAFYATAHFAVTLGVLGWLYVRRPDEYRGLRTALIIATAIALIGFWLYPLAPPRFLGGHGFVDPVTALHTFGLYSSPRMGSLTNQLAAMPSMHAGWALWCAVAVTALTRRPLVRAVAALYPAVTVFVIFATANHYVIDALAGFAVMIVALFAALYRHKRGRRITN